MSNFDETGNGGRKPADDSLGLATEQDIQRIHRLLVGDPLATADPKSTSNWGLLQFVRALDARLDEYPDPDVLQKIVKSFEESQELKKEAKKTVIMKTLEVLIPVVLTASLAGAAISIGIYVSKFLQGG